MKWKVVVGILFIIQLSLAFNPKSVDWLLTNVTLYGELKVDGTMDEINITLFIPQNVLNLDVWSDHKNEYRYIYDKMGNKRLLLKWKNVKRNVKYRVNVITENRAFKAEDVTEPFYDKGPESPFFVFTPEIIETSYLFEDTLDGIAKMTEWVHDYIKYDVSVYPDPKPSDWVYEHKRGVCTEFSTLMLTFLKAKKIKSRLVIGYSFDQVNNSFIGHAWVEVLFRNKSGGLVWVPFDPTWAEAGIIDGTHIKTAIAKDPNLSETLRYRGFGSMKWEKMENIKPISYNFSYLPFDIEVNHSNKYGIIKATFSDHCSLRRIEAKSCVNMYGENVIQIFEPVRKVWVCNGSTLYWGFKILEREKNYICPVIIFDQAGFYRIVNITVLNREETLPDVFLLGPDVVEAKEKFNITLNKDGVVFSSFSHGNEHRISIPGRYTLYGYYGGVLVMKNITVVQQKDISVSFRSPSNASVETSFNITVFLRNHGAPKLVNITVIFGDNEFEKKNVYLSDNVSIEFSLVPKQPGEKQIIVIVHGNGVVSVSDVIKVEGEELHFGMLFKKFIEFIESLIGWFA